MYALRIAGKQQPGNKQRIGGFSFRKVRPILSPPPGLAGLVSAADRSIGCDSLIYVSSHYGNARGAIIQAKLGPRTMIIPKGDYALSRRSRGRALRPKNSA
jgi:hypothetical protein